MRWAAHRAVAPRACRDRGERPRSRRGRQRLATRPDDFLAVLARRLLAVEALRRGGARADVVAVGGALILLQPPVKLAENIRDLAGVVVELAIENVLVLAALAEGLRRAGDRNRPAPAVLRIDDEGEPLDAVIE